jgi:hypothetical protein
MLKCTLLPRCTGLGAAASLALLTMPLPGRADLLYKLQTQCSLDTAAAVPCTVEAVNEAGATLYRHHIGDKLITVRITDKPVRMELWNAAGRQWKSLERAAALFSTNTVCFNGGQLCVVNANYLNSVREDNSAAMAKRDLVKVQFGADGRINASCYDDGCQAVQK